MITNLYKFLKFAFKDEDITLKPISCNSFDKEKWISAFNPSICIFNNELYGCIRLSNYMWNFSSFNFNYKNSISIKENIRTESIIEIFKLNKKTLNIEDEFLVIIPDEFFKNKNQIYGIEDCRIFEYKKNLYIIGTIGKDKIRLVIAKLELDITTHSFKFAKYSIIDYNKNNQTIIKNNIPILNNKNLSFLYDTFPKSIIFSLDDDLNFLTEEIIDNSKSNLFKIRGSSQIVEYNNFKIGIFHKMVINYGFATYSSLLCFFNNNFEYITSSDEFKFMNELIEFCCGLAIYEKYAYIAFSTNDNHPFILKLPVDILLILKDKSKINNLLFDFYLDCIENNKFDYDSYLQLAMLEFSNKNYSSSYNYLTICNDIIKYLKISDTSLLAMINDKFKLFNNIITKTKISFKDYDKTYLINNIKKYKTYNGYDSWN